MKKPSERIHLSPNIRWMTIANGNQYNNCLHLAVLLKCCGIDFPNALTSEHTEQMSINNFQE